jgi:TPR repeat protein
LNEVRGKGDGRKALEAIHGSATRGDARSQVRLGRMYLDGAGVDQDFDLALEWFQRSAEQGNGEAFAYLGHMHEKGLGIDQDIQKASEFYRKSAAQGSALGQVRLGDLYLNGSGVEQNFRKALARYQKAAEQGGDPENAGLALLKLAALHCQGRGVEKDLRKGFELYERSAKLGNAEAQLCVGAMYRDGMGVGRNHRKALEWFKKSAKSDKARADSAMGDIYRDGLLVEKDVQEAIRWYEKAAENGDRYAKTELLKLKQEASIERVFKTNLALAGTGDPKAMAEVAEMYRTGLGVAKSEEMAREWFEKAAASGNVSVRGKLQQVQRSIGARVVAEKKIPEKKVRPAVPGSKRRKGKAPARKTLLVASSAIGFIAISLLIVSLGRGRESGTSPESLRPKIAGTAARPRPERPAVPAEILMLAAATSPKTDAGTIPRKTKVDKPLPIPEANPAGEKSEAVVPLFRREYRSLDREEITRMLAARNLFDAERNPKGGFQHRYEPLDVAGLTLIVDRATKLVWTRQQNPVRMNLKKTIQWIESLNRAGYGGLRSWRLPTVEEAASLLRRSAADEKTFMDAVFGGDVQAVWTGDGLSESESWSVDFQEGRIEPAKNKSRLMMLMVSSDADLSGKEAPAQGTRATAGREETGNQPSDEGAKRERQIRAGRLRSR